MPKNVGQACFLAATCSNFAKKEYSPSSDYYCISNIQKNYASIFGFFVILLDTKSIFNTSIQLSHHFYFGRIIFTAYRQKGLTAAQSWIKNFLVQHWLILFRDVSYKYVVV